MGKIPILTHIFQMGWFNHQPEFLYVNFFFQLGTYPTRVFLVSQLRHVQDASYDVWSVWAVFRCV